MLWFNFIYQCLVNFSAVAANDGELVLSINNRSSCATWRIRLSCCNEIFNNNFATVTRSSWLERFPTRSVGGTAAASGGAGRCSAGGCWPPARRGREAAARSGPQSAGRWLSCWERATSVKLERLPEYLRDTVDWFMGWVAARPCTAHHAPGAPGSIPPSTSTLSLGPTVLCLMLTTEHWPILTVYVLGNHLKSFKTC